MSRLGSHEHTSTVRRKPSYGDPGSGPRRNFDPARDRAGGRRRERAGLHLPGRWLLFARRRGRGLGPRIRSPDRVRDLEQAEGHVYGRAAVRPDPEGRREWAMPDRRGHDHGHRGTQGAARFLHSLLPEPRRGGPEDVQRLRPARGSQGTSSGDGEGNPFRRPGEQHPRRQGRPCG